MTFLRYDRTRERVIRRTKPGSVIQEVGKYQLRWQRERRLTPWTTSKTE